MCLGAVALSVFARSNLTSSGLHGWVYCTLEKVWPVTVGIALILACVVAAVQLFIRTSAVAFGVSFALVIPVMFVACAGYGACF